MAIYDHVYISSSFLQLWEVITQFLSNLFLLFFPKMDCPSCSFQNTLYHSVTEWYFEKDLNPLCSVLRYEVRQNAFKLFLATLWLNYKYFLQHLLCSFPQKNASHSFVRLYKTSKVSITHILLFEFSKRSQLYLGNLSFQYVNCKYIQWNLGRSQKLYFGRYHRK